jgi:hypothetical protein
MENVSDKIPNLSLKKYSGDNYEFFEVEGFVVLDAWKGFQSRGGAYGSIDSNEVSDGSVRITVDAEVVEGIAKITEAQVNAYNYLIQHQEKIKEAILQALLADYKNMQEYYDYDEGDEEMPAVDNVSQFCNLIGLSTIHIIDVRKDNIAYVGYQFGCSWDGEHGLGFMTHTDRVIHVGWAADSFQSGEAENDLNKKDNP